MVHVQIKITNHIILLRPIGQIIHQIFCVHYFDSWFNLHQKNYMTFHYYSVILLLRSFGFPYNIYMLRLYIFHNNIFKLYIPIFSLYVCLIRISMLVGYITVYSSKLMMLFAEHDKSFASKKEYIVISLVPC